MTALSSSSPGATATFFRESRHSGERGDNINEANSRRRKGTASCSLRQNTRPQQGNGINMSSSTMRMTMASVGVWLLVSMSSPASSSSSYSYLSPVLLCRAEAFTTSSASRGSRFWGMQMRGGESTAKSPSSTTTVSGTTTMNNKNKKTMTCVMQMPPRTDSYSVQASEDDRHQQDLSKSTVRPKHDNTWKNGAARFVNKSILSIKNGRIVTAADQLHNGMNNLHGGAAATKAAFPLLEYVAETKLPTDVGHFFLRAYRLLDPVTGRPMIGNEPCVIYAQDKPPFRSNSAIPVRIHDQCLTSEVFRSQRCDCKEQLHMSLNYIQKHGGCIIYLQQEGRGIGLANKIAAYALQDGGLDTVDANLHLGFPEDSREYGVVPEILDDMNIQSIQLMTNNPRKVDLLDRLGVHVERTLPMVVPSTNQYNHKYLETKRNRMNHQNLATLLAQDPTLLTSASPLVSSMGELMNGNGLMAPRRSLADQYINNGTEMSANAVQVSLMIEEDEDEEVAVLDADGVRAAEDGYCFGKQSVLDAINAIARGEMVVVVDDMDRENEGDFIMAADMCTDLDMARIIRYSSGVICVAMEGKRMEELKIPPMVINNEDPKGTAFGVSVDAVKEHGITTGISASDRATTVQLLADPHATASDFHRPGHLFPLRAREGGVLVRNGHTEATVDLARLAGRSPCGVLCEIVSEENPTEMMRLPEIRRFCKRHGFIMTSIADLAQYRRETEQ